MTRAILLAAGAGKRLNGDAPDARPLPKCLLELGGKTLLERHLDALDRCSVHQVDIVVGYRRETVAQATQRVTDGGRLATTLYSNLRYHLGSVVSLAMACDALRSGPCVVMDADVLYPTALLRRLLESPSENCVLLDRRCVPDEEAMRLGADADGRVRTIRRGLSRGYPVIGEGVGFIKLSAEASTALADAALELIQDGETEADYECAIDDVMQTHHVAYEFVEPHPWTEIDFPEDLERAARAILPQLEG